MSLWFAAALLVLAAVGFAVAPFLRPARDADDGKGSGESFAGGAGRGGSEDDSAEEDVSTNESQGAGSRFAAMAEAGEAGNRGRALRALYRQRLQELEEEHAAGILDAPSRAEIEQELARGLLDEFETLDTSPENKSRAEGMQKRAGLLVAIVLPLLALAAYFQVGEPQAPLLQEARRVLELDPEADRLEVDRWRVLLATRLEQHPDDAQSRYLLGQIYFRDGDYAKAAETFALAHASVGEDPVLDWAWLQALYLANGGWLDDTGKGIAARMLKREPNNPMVLEIVAIDAYRRGDYRESVGRFNQALGNVLAPTHRAALQHFVVQARSMLGDLQPRINVRLSASAVPPESATLFVIARPVGGGMPYAVVRRAAVPLPNQVILDDAVTMNPDLPLSAAQRVEVVARISLTGTAMRRPGDWQWVSDPFLIDNTQSISVAAQLHPPESRDDAGSQGSHFPTELD